MRANHNRQLLRRTITVAVIALGAGMVISFRATGTWWLLLMAVLAWVHTLLLRREITTSGLPLRIFNAVSWALLGFALVSLLPLSIRVVGDVVVLLIALAAFVGTHLRRAR